jgi:hypothetical protein
VFTDLLSDKTAARMKKPVDNLGLKGGVSIDDDVKLVRSFRAGANLKMDRRCTLRRSKLSRSSNHLGVRIDTE